MAMLAEPRKKQKFSVDPRNLNWSKDESKVGQKMLEKMGWSKGKGLGASEQGEVDHITVRAKNDVKGVGCSNTYADTWIAHQDDFNSLLANLNADHSGSGTNTPDPDKVASLEHSSKSSKSRLHYGKYTRGKDLSTRGVEELECIFGKKKKIYLEEMEENKVASPSDDEEEDADQNLVTSSQSVAEYFAKKMAALRRSRGGTTVTANSAEHVSDDMAVETETPEPELNPEIGTDEILHIKDTCTNQDDQSIAKKKKKKKKKNDVGESENEEPNVVKEVIVGNQNEELSYKKIQKTIPFKAENGLSAELTSVKLKKKKKKKCKKTHKSEPDELHQISRASNETESSEENKQSADKNANGLGDSVEKKDKCKKSKKKRKRVSDLEDATVSKKVRKSTGSNDISVSKKQKDKNPKESSTSKRYVIEKKTGKKIYIDDLQLDKKFKGSNLMDVGPYGEAK